MNQYLLIDVGGSAVKYAVCDDELHLTQKGRHPLAMGQSKELLYQTIEEILKTITADVQGIAISMPGIIDEVNGINFASTMLKENNVPVASEIKERFSLPCAVINDGYAAGSAELGFGNMKGVENGIVLVLGTGIGGAMILDGHLHTGRRHSAANFSFIYSDITNPADPQTMFTGYNGIQGLKDAVKETAGIEDCDGLKTFALIKEGNEKVRAGLELFCDHLAYQIYNLQAVLDADRVLIGGGISNEPSFLSYVQEAVDRRWSTARIPLAKPEVLNCRYNNDANLLGAFYNYQLHHN